MPNAGKILSPATAVPFCKTIERSTGTVTRLTGIMFNGSPLELSILAGSSLPT